MAMCLMLKFTLPMEKGNKAFKDGGLSFLSMLQLPPRLLADIQSNAVDVRL